MKFDIPCPCFFSKVSFEEGIRRTAALGFKYIETYQWSTYDIESVKNTLDETGVTLLSLCTSDFRLTSPENREIWLSGLRDSVKVANRLGAKMLITQVGQDTGARRDYQHESIVKGLTAARDILADSGVTIMIEPLNTKVNHPGYYLWSAFEGFDIIREVNHPNVKLIYDIYHQQVMEGDIIRTVESNLDCIAHLHAAGHPGRHELQNGELDYKFIFAAIDKTPYDGFCGIEYNPLLPPEESINEFRRLYM